MDTSTIRYALVVDDDPFIQMDVCDILEEAGFRHFEASTADEARAVLEARNGIITLLFSDVEMPGNMDGFALARLTAEQWPDIEIVIASGRASPLDGDLPPKATFISKPFCAQTVHDHLREKLPDEKKPDRLQDATD